MRLHGRDKGAAKAKLEGLDQALKDITAIRGPFFAALGDRMDPQRKRKLENQLNEFIAYQEDTAQLGLTISRPRPCCRRPRSRPSRAASR